MRKTGYAAAVALVMAISGCAMLGRQAFQPPVVALKDVRVVGIGLTGGSLDVVLSVYNPNGFRLDATKLTYVVKIDSTQLASGQMDSRFTVLNKDSSQVRIPVQFTYAGLGAAGRSILNNGTLNYNVTGAVTVGTPIGSFTRPFSQTGRFSTMKR